MLSNPPTHHPLPFRSHFLLFILPELEYAALPPYLDTAYQLVLERCQALSISIC
jgi:hypothetical protein